MPSTSRTSEVAASDPGTGASLEKDRPACIQRAALELIGEVGYERMTMDAIATRAKASKATIYRRWDSKAALVVDALSCRDETARVVSPDTGDLRSDLIEGLLTLAADMADRDVCLITGLITAMRTDPELSRLLREQVFGTKRQASRVWAAGAIARGEVSEDADFDLVHEVVMSLVFQRIALTGDPVDLPFVVRVVDDVLLPILHRPALH